MTVAELLTELKSKGVTLVADGDKLRCRGKPSALTPELVNELRQHKGEVMALLSRTACTCNPLPSFLDVGHMAHAGCGPDYDCCSVCGKTWQCKICGGCRYCRTPG